MPNRADYGDAGALANLLGMQPQKTSPLAKSLIGINNTSEKQLFDPEGEGYDHITAQELEELYPLTMPKPTDAPKEGEPTTVSNEEAQSAWVWHKDANEWVKHGASVDRRTGRLLKGKNYPTFWMEEKASQDLGNIIVKKPDGYYYSLTPEGKIYGQDQ